jgi:hypothetical protein
MSISRTLFLETLDLVLGIDIVLCEFPTIGKRFVAKGAEMNGWEGRKVGAKFSIPLKERHILNRLYLDLTEGVPRTRETIMMLGKERKWTEEGRNTSARLET